MRTAKKQMPLTKAVEGFILSRRAEGISPHTILIYQWAFQRMMEFLGDQDISSIKSDDIQRFYLWLQTDYKPSRKNGDSSALKPSSVEKAWSTLRSFYQWANESIGVERADLTIKRPKYRTKEITPFTELELKALLSRPTWFIQTGFFRRLHLLAQKSHDLILSAYFDADVKADCF